MRLWHKDLIPVLPCQQLLAQWRECCCIARNISINDTPNHILVNKVMNYRITSFETYCILVIKEMQKRGYKVSPKAVEKLEDNLFDWSLHEMKPQVFRLLSDKLVEYDKLFPDWHNDRYLTQCLCNLQEKYDCGGISEDEWSEIDKHFKLMTNCIREKTIVF